MKVLLEDVSFTEQHLSIMAMPIYRIYIIGLVRQTRNMKVMQIILYIWFQNSSQEKVYLK